MELEKCFYDFIFDKSITEDVLLLKNIILNRKTSIDNEELSYLQKKVKLYNIKYGPVIPTEYNLVDSEKVCFYRNEDNTIIAVFICENYQKHSMNYAPILIKKYNITLEEVFWENNFFKKIFPIFR